MYIFYYIFIYYLFCICIFFYWICIALFQFYSIFNFAQKTILLFFLLDELLLSPLDSINFVFVFSIKIFVNYYFSTGCRFLKQNQLFEISWNAFHSHFNLHFLLEYFVYFVFNAFLVCECVSCVFWLRLRLLTFVVIRSVRGDDLEPTKGAHKLSHRCQCARRCSCRC